MRVNFKKQFADEVSIEVIVMGKELKKGIKYEIFVGMKDKDSYEEIFDAEDFKNILTEICTEKEIGFSLLTQMGGYSHNKGYTTETSLRVIIIGIDEEEVQTIGARLKALINTDTILITKTEVEYCFLSSEVG
ncbi:MAG: hypothetical protein IJH95_08000 [Mogibacterium sp.]|nr:hypothetical protein [Mogibacterium sp.]